MEFLKMKVLSVLESAQIERLERVARRELNFNN